ncbi:MAG: hypothetical protein Q9227_001779 [Pyrenula ochraceoflavens]
MAQGDRDALTVVTPDESSIQRHNFANQLTQLNTKGDGGLIAQLSTNPFFTAGFGLAALGFAATTAQRGLRYGATLLRQRMLVNVEINVKDESYHWFLDWMTCHQRAQLVHQSQLRAGEAQKQTLSETLFNKLTPRMRNLSIQTEKIVHPNGAIQTQFSLYPGVGRHFIRYKNAFIMANRIRDEKSREHSSGKPWETITLTTLYRHRRVFEEMFAEAHLLASKAQEGKTVIYKSWSTQWERFGEPRRKRPIDSVILDVGVKDRILDDIKDFIGSASWYYDRGIPYRRGYLLHGPPGSGKSSFIQALAGHLDYDIAIVNLSERGLTDDRLNHLLMNLPKRTIALLEDVDAAFSNRRVQIEADGYQGANVTFSGLLNALDGVASAEERVIFMTTNHAERLDQALVRPGRVDLIVRIGEATRHQVEQLWDRFYGDLAENTRFKQDFLSKLTRLGCISDADGDSPRFATSTAALQGLFLYNKGDMQGAIAMADYLVQTARELQTSEEAPPKQVARHPS